jgi:ParB family transcriptional regulator, chromosome partitioning protein
MPLSDQYMKVPLDKITVMRDNRQRSTVETDDLQKSIQQIGLINPIVVRQEEDQLILVAGERRLTAFRILASKYPSDDGYTDIPVRFADSLSVIEAAIIELEENIKRRDLPWQDTVRAVAKLHGLHMDSDPDWDQRKTAQALSMADGTISMYLKVESHLEESRIAGCPTVRNAYDVLERREDRRKSVARAALLEGEDLDDDDLDDSDLDDDQNVVSLHPGNDTKLKQRPAGVLTAADVDAYMNSEEAGLSPYERKELEKITILGNGSKPGIKSVPASPLNLADDIIHGSFLEWAPSYTRRRFDFIHCDFPYGTLELGPQMQGNEHEYYEDSPELYIALLDCFCENLDKFMAGSAWCIFWYSERMGPATREILKVKAPSLTVQTHPLIWIHSDNSGISPDFKKRPRHIYDTALLMHRGEDVQLLRLKSDAYASPTDHKLHPSTKPEPMLRYFFEMFVDNHTVMLDPTCGSGSSLRAAESLGAARVLGIEADWNHCETARGALKDSRNKMRILDAMSASLNDPEEELINEKEN